MFVATTPWQLWFPCPLCLSLSPAECFLFLFWQGQPASRDWVPLYPCCSADNNQRVTRGQRARSCNLLAAPLAALQANVCLWCGEAHITLSHVVGSYRYVWVLLYGVGVCILLSGSPSIFFPRFDYVYFSLCVEQLWHITMKLSVFQPSWPGLPTSCRYGGRSWVWWEPLS